MNSANSLADSVPLILLHKLKEGIESGRIADLNSVRTEIDATITDLNSSPEKHANINDLVGRVLLEIRSLRDQVTQYKERLGDFQVQAQVLRQDTSQIAARAEACNLMAEQQQKENAQVLASVERAKATASTVQPPCVAPAPSPVDPSMRPTPSRSAVVSFPGGPRTITIHPPGSPNYRPVIRDVKGDIVLAFGRTKPLYREGAFIGPLDDVDWFETTTCVYGRDDLGIPAASTIQRRNPSGPPPRPASRVSNDIVSGDGVASSSQDSQPSSNGTKPETISPASSALSSPTPAIGKKRPRDDEEDGDDREALSVTETHGEALALVALRNVNEPVTPKPVKRDDIHLPEGPAKKKLRPSAGEGLPKRTLGRTQTFFDVTRTA